ncbi:uncharacterized protein BT62DRAFT_1006696 [Guyanagaster necrorhizus]|uniref:Peptidase A1 domain-containing protein n=1 Tax=Guyanagaster necrorhizus TaxID=856835 RepID=A0A9P7VS98_9AGAR|nr:uncharacterized protein BT62DRAFT_1006696 [Guyanagaster necrorhizus MCA 3950]KAG7445662.1 hypothetical protein BT62DRAFT_1006696 [Guyanagaster necrorhizus MCA 3950]
MDHRSNFLRSTEFGYNIDIFAYTLVIYARQTQTTLDCRAWAIGRLLLSSLPPSSFLNTTLLRSVFIMPRDNANAPPFSTVSTPSADTPRTFFLATGLARRSSYPACSLTDLLSSRRWARETVRVAHRLFSVRASVQPLLIPPWGKIGEPDQSFTLLIDTGVYSVNIIEPRLFSLRIPQEASNTWVGADKEHKPSPSSKNTRKSINVSYGSGFFTGTEVIDRRELSPDLVIDQQSIGRVHWFVMMASLSSRGSVVFMTRRTVTLDWLISPTPRIIPINDLSLILPFASLSTIVIPWMVFRLAENMGDRMKLGVEPPRHSRRCVIARDILSFERAKTIFCGIEAKCIRQLEL